MEHAEMVALIRAGVPQSGGVWADLGAGTGNFSWALAELLGPGGTVHALDRDARAVQAMLRRLEAAPPAATVLPRQADVTRALGLPALDGALLANLLHFLADPRPLLRALRALIRPGGALLVVEYEQDKPIAWVPHPLPLARLTALLAETGFTAPTIVGRRVSPSSGRAMYAARATTSECVEQRGSL